MSKKKIAFICVHNSCRSQIAEALGKHLAGDKFDFYSAGTETKPQIDQDAVRLMKQLYGIDMEQSQYSKTIDKIPCLTLRFRWGVMSAVHISAGPLTMTGDLQTRQARAMDISYRLLKKLPERSNALMMRIFR